MEKTLKWLDEHLEEVLCVTFMATIAVVIFIQVIMRYVFHNSLSWSEELARYCFIWLIYLGAGYGARYAQHIKIEAALLLYPKALRPYIVILGELLVLSLSVYILISGLQLTELQLHYGKNSPALGLSMAVVNAAPAVGFGLVIIRQIQNVFKHIAALGTDAASGDAQTSAGKE